MKTWLKALTTAAVIEVPQVIFLARSISDLGKSSLLLNALCSYHVLAIWFAQFVLLVWNPGPRQGPTSASNAVAWLSVFGFQVILTTPIIYGLLLCFGYIRSNGYTKRNNHSPAEKP